MAYESRMQSAICGTDTAYVSRMQCAVYGTDVAYQESKARVEQEIELRHNVQTELDNVQSAVQGAQPILVPSTPCCTAQYTTTNHMFFVPRKSTVHILPHYIPRSECLVLSVCSGAGVLTSHVPCHVGSTERRASRYKGGGKPQPGPDCHHSECIY
eukprot:2723274-Rhodomonas_salina.4